MIIWYIIDHIEKKFFFFEENDWKKASTKEKELAKKHGYKELHGTKISPCPRQRKKLKHYYGTIWLRYEWTESGSVHYNIFGRYKDAKMFKSDTEKIKKFVLTPYEEFKKRFE